MAKQMIFLGADHGGFKLKEAIKEYLAKSGRSVVDMGNTIYDKTDDYPKFALAVAQKVADGKALGILVCTSGVGMDMAANKVNGVFSVLAHNADIAAKAREHEGANVLCLGSNHTSPKEAEEIIEAWLSKSFSRAQRHRRRVKMLNNIEKNQCRKK